METQVTSNAPGRDISKKTYALNKKSDGLPAPRVIHGNTLSGIQNMAAFSKTAMGDTTSQPTFWYSPEMQPDSYLLPKTRAETLRFCQIYYNLDPYIHSILNMHAQYGFSKFYLQYKDPDITTLFNKLLFYNQDFDWYQFTLDVALSYWKYGEACLHSDTKIKLLDGTTPTIEELYKSGAKDFWVYSIDEQGNIVPSKANKVILTKKNAPMVKVILDDDSYFQCTPDHKILMRDGSYKEAKDLLPGEPIMPLYIKYRHVYYKKDKSKDAYEMVFNPGKLIDRSVAHGKWVYTHRLVASSFYENSKKGTVIHHKNYNKYDNRPENLQCMSLIEHQKLHTRHYTAEQIENFREKTRDLYRKPGYAEKMGVLIKAGLANPEVRKKISEASKRMWANPEYRAKRSGFVGRKWTAEQKEAASRRFKERWSSLSDEQKNNIRAIALKNLEKINKGSYKNHKVKAIIAGDTGNVYDIQIVDKYHNFAIVTGNNSGVFVHNCVWGSWNSARRTWDRFTLINPAIVEYKEDLMTGHATMELIPTNEMKRIVKDALLQGRRDIDPLLLNAIENNKKLPLDTEGIPENVFTGQDYVPPKVFMFQRRTDPSSERGTSAIVCLMKDLIYKDQLRMSQIAVAQKTQLPIELWTVGHIGNDEQSSMLPGPELLEEVRQMITQATQQPPFSIVYGPYLKYEALGVTGKLLDIYNDLGYVENQILVGLGVNKAVVLGEGPSVQGKAISLNRLVREYAVVRDLFSNWFKRNILLPISKANHLVDEEGQYILPNLVWELSLQPEQDKETFDMFYKMWKDGLISTMTLFEKCPKQIDYTLEMQRLSEEVGSPFDKGDKRLGKNTSADAGGSAKGGDSELDTAKSKGVEAGKGNPELRDFALGGGADDALGDLETDIPAEGEAGGAEEAPEPMEGE